LPIVSISSIVLTNDQNTCSLQECSHVSCNVGGTLRVDQPAHSIPRGGSSSPHRRVESPPPYSAEDPDPSPRYEPQLNDVFHPRSPARHITPQPYTATPLILTRCQNQRSSNHIYDPVSRQDVRPPQQPRRPDSPGCSSNGQRPPPVRCQSVGGYRKDFMGSSEPRSQPQPVRRSDSPQRPSYQVNSSTRRQSSSHPTSSPRRASESTQQGRDPRLVRYGTYIIQRATDETIQSQDHIDKEGLIKARPITGKNFKLHVRIWYR
jgi:hypothetical protein